MSQNVCQYCGCYHSPDVKCKDVQKPELPMDAAHSTPAAPKRDAVSTWGFSENLPVLPKATPAAPAAKYGTSAQAEQAAKQWSTPAAPVRSVSGECEGHEDEPIPRGRTLWGIQHEPHIKRNACVNWRPVAAPPPQPSDRVEIAKEYGLTLEGGDWYFDVAVFQKHAALQRLVNELLDLKAAHPSTHAEPAQMIETDRLREAIVVAIRCIRRNSSQAQKDWTVDYLNKILAHPSTHSDPSDERAAFEKWAVKHLGDKRFLLRFPGNPERYDMYVTDHLWEAWQARASLERNK